MSAERLAPSAMQGDAAEGSPRLLTVRRLYFYLFSLISSTVALVAISQLLSALTEIWLTAGSNTILFGDAYQLRSIALSAGLLIVSAPLFLLHWRVIGRWLDHPGERQAGMRKFFLYAASAIALGVLAVQSAHLIEGVARLALGERPAFSTILPSEWLQDLSFAVVSGLLLFYWQWVLRQDGDFGQESGMAIVWRRLFLAGVTVVGLALIIFGSAMLIGSLLERLLEVFTPPISSGWFAPTAATGIAQIIVGTLLARTGWQVWQARIAVNPEEEFSTIRRVFLYVAVIGGALATLIPTALILQVLLRWSFSDFGTPWFEIVTQVAYLLSFLPAGLLIWRGFVAQLNALEQREAVSTRPGSSRDAAAAVRRIYHYSVAATGLVLLWIGAVAVVQVVLDQWLTAQKVVGESLWYEPLARGISFVAVGAPVWAVHWRRSQNIARLTTAEGAAERASLPRRLYLYGVSLAGALVILIFLARVLYRFFLVLMGDTSTEIFSPELAEDLARVAIAAILWGVHLAALRTDMRDATDPAAGGIAHRRDRIERRIATLESELAGLRSELAELEPATDAQHLSP